MVTVENRLETTPAVLARPRSHPLPIDPHAAVGWLVEAFDEVLDLRLHLLIPHGLGRLVDVHHHGPLEVGDGAGSSAAWWSASSVLHAGQRCGWSKCA
jgi:hypothetical protein